MLQGNIIAVMGSAPLNFDDCVVGNIEIVSCRCAEAAVVNLKQILSPRISLINID